MLHLLVGIDTEGDNQWDEASRANQTFENIYALPTLHALFARRSRAADLPRHPPGGLRRPLRRRAARAPRAGRLRDRRAPPRVGDAAVRARGRPPPHLRARAAARAVRAAGRHADRRHRGGGRRAAGRRTGRDGSGSRPRTCRRSSAPATWSSRASPRCSTRRTRAGPTSSRRRSSRTSSSYDDACRPGSSHLLELPVSAALNRRYPAWLRHRYARAPVALHDQADPAEARHRADAVAAAVVLVARRHEAAGAPARRGRRAAAQPAVPLERSHRRRQPVQSDRRRTRGVLRSPRPVPRVRDLGAWRRRRRRSPSSAPGS